MGDGPKTIVAFLDESESGRARLELAIEIARTYRSHLVAAFVELPPRRPPAEGASDFARGTGMDAAIETYLEKQGESVNALRRRLSSAAREFDFGDEWRTVAAQAQLREVAVHGTYCDLMILPPLGGGFDANPWSPADLVLVSGVPGIVVPAAAGLRSCGRRVLVAWNESRVARRAIGDAMPFLARAESVHVVVVDERGPRLNAKDPGADVAHLLARHDVAATVDYVASEGRDAADVLLERAVSLGADLLVAGAYGHSRFSEIVFGSTTRRLLRGSSVPAFISH